MVALALIQKWNEMVLEHHVHLCGMLINGLYQEYYSGNLFFLQSMSRKLQSREANLYLIMLIEHFQFKTAALPSQKS
jgi:hypothetical protein